MTSHCGSKRTKRLGLPATIAALVALAIVQSPGYALDARQPDVATLDAEVQGATKLGTTYRGRTPNRSMEIGRLGKINRLYALVTPQDPLLDLCEADITEGGWGRTTGSLTIPSAEATFGGNATGDRRGFADGQQEYVDHNDVAPFTVHSVVIISVICDPVLDALLNPGKRAVITGQADVRSQSPEALQEGFMIELYDFGEPGRGRDTYQIRLIGDFPYDSGPITLQGGNVRIRY